MKAKKLILWSTLALSLFSSLTSSITAQEESEQIESTQEESQAINQEQAMETVDLPAINEVTLEEGNPVSLIDALQNQPQFVSNGFNILEGISEEEFAVTSIGYVRDGEQYYVMQSAPFGINSSVLIETQEGEFTRSLISSDDLMAFMAEALNNYPDIYAGTVVEEFYQFAQSNGDEISGLMIENQFATAEHQAMYEEITTLDAVFLNTLRQYFETEGVEPAVVESEIGDILAYEIVAEAYPTFQEVILGQEADYPEVAYLFDFFEQDLTGTVALSMNTGSISLSFINAAGNNAVEYIIGLDQLSVFRPEDDQVVSADAFNEMIGIELFGELEEIEASVEESDVSTEEETTEESSEETTEESTNE